MSNPTLGEEEFGSPNTAFAKEMNLGEFDQARPGNKAELSRKSLYVAFDPLVGSDTPKASNESKTHHHRLLPETPQDGGKLLDFDTPLKPAHEVKLEPTTDLLTADIDTLDLSSKSALKDEESTPVFTKKTQLVINSPDTPQASSANVSHEKGNVQALIDAAVAQSREEITILQIEVDDLRSKLAEERANNLEMTRVVESYNATLTEMVESQAKQDSGASAKVSQLEQQVATVKQEKAQVEIDLNKTEAAFSDLHRKYEKLKEVLENYRQNEAKLKAAVEERNAAVVEATAKFNTLKEHAEKKLELANAEIASVREQYKKEVIAQNAKLKAAEVKMGQLERQLATKEKDNAELTAICEDLVKQLEAVK